MSDNKVEVMESDELVFEFEDTSSDVDTSQDVESKLNDDTEVEQSEGESKDVSTTEGQSESVSDESKEESEDTIEVDGESKPAPSWLKDLRKSQKHLKKENEELKRKLEQVNKPKVEELKKPKLEDFDFDTERYDEALEQYVEQKAQLKKSEDERKAREAKVEREWQAKVEQFKTAKQSLNKKDYDEVEQLIASKLSPLRQSAIVHLSDNPAITAYVLGKNTKELERLAAIEDDAKFIYELAKLETKIKTQKKTTTAPEKIVKTAQTTVGDAHLDKLRAQAEKTGDYSEVMKYKQKIKGSNK